MVRDLLKDKSGGLPGRTYLEPGSFLGYQTPRLATKKKSGRGAGDSTNL